MGSIKATLLSVLPAIVASIWMMGIVGWVGSGVSITTVLAPIFTLIIGSADGLHFISHFQESYTQNQDKRRAVVDTLKMVGMPMIVTTLTTMVGFLSLLTVREEVVSTLVIIASSGVLLAGVATWWVLPILLTSKITLKPVKTKHMKTVTFLRHLWGKPILVLVVALSILTVMVLPNLRTDFNQLMFYKENTELYQSFEAIEKATGGGVPLMIAFEWEEGENPMAISEVIEGALDESPYISRVVGLHKISNRFSGSEFEKQFVDSSRRVGRVIAFPSQFTDESLAAIESTIDGLPLKRAAQVTSVQFIMRDLNQQMVSAQLSTQFYAIGLIFLMILAALRRLLPSIVALLPIILTMFFLYGYLAILKIPLNLFTILMFSISIGIGIDYAIHFVSVWAIYTKKGLHSEEAIHLAFQYTSRPILANAIGLALGMSALMLSPLKIHTFLSLVMWFTMSASVVLTLTVLPTILKRLSK
ncbi:MAG TPA: hypothetical protein DCS67_02730 [Clostridiales bacterium UBA8960]|nr:hypothetical protein [Clostridiales bacterium UBA8960]